MKIEQINDKIIIYLKKEQIDNINFKDIDELEDYFKNLFLKLNRIVDIDINGFYLLNIYLDDYYGAALEIIKEEDTYTFYLDGQIDMRINIIKTDFLYEIDNYNIDRSKFDIYLYENKIYIKLKEQIAKKEMFTLLENSKFIYDSENIIIKGKKL